MNSNFRQVSSSINRITVRAVFLGLLVCGLMSAQSHRVARAEIFAATGAWESITAMNVARKSHTVTLLQDGRLLAAGGMDGSNQSLKSAELYDPATGRWTLTGELNEARSAHSAALLKDGRVLVVGLQSAETYDPTTGKWTLTGDMSLKNGPGSYENVPAILLADGKVLVAGGRSGSLSFARAGAELFDPATGKWSLTSSLTLPRYGYAAALLPNGKVLVAGGINRLENQLVAEIYDPVAGKWAQTASLKFPRVNSTAITLPNGTVLLVGGANTDTGREAEIYNPINETWSFTGNLNFSGSQVASALLPGGKVLRVGTHSEIYDTENGRWTIMAEPLSGRSGHTLTAMANGKAVAVGGIGGNTTVRSAELFNPAGIPVPGIWLSGGGLGVRRQAHTATLLADGKVLFAGGGWQVDEASRKEVLASASIFDPVQGITDVAPLSTARQYHTATLLPNGQVIVVGGELNSNTTLLSAELFNPATKSWQSAASLIGPRRHHTATLLNNGKVLIVGGANDSSDLATAELYDPAANRWAITGSLSTARRYHTATLLADGKVLVVGGENNGSAINTAEIYNPDTGVWSATGILNNARKRHTATQLLNGKILVTGGASAATLAAAETFDPITGIWTPTAALTIARQNHTATLLTDGRVLVAAGSGTEGRLASTEIFDPAANGGAGGFSNADALDAAREIQTATKLMDGKVLVAGGLGNAFGGNGASAETQASIEIFDPLAIATPPQPLRITPVSATTYRGGAIATDSIVAIFGERFTNTTVVAGTTPLPVNLGGVRVAIRRLGLDIPLSLFFVSPNQVNCSISTPLFQQISPGALTMILTTSDGVSISEPINIVPVAPGLFSADASGTGLAAAVVLRAKANGDQVYEPVTRFDPAQNRIVAAPIDLSNANEQVFLILYGTGIRNRSGLTATTASVGGTPAEVLYAGVQADFVGLDQINLRLPSSLAGRGEVDVRVTADGTPTNAVKISVK